MNEHDLMRKALSAYGLDRQAICQAARREGAARLQKGETAMKQHKLTVAFAIVLAAACLGGCVCAASVLLSAGEAAAAAGPDAVATLFEGDDAVEIHETQRDAGYDVTLLGLVTGDHLTESWNSSWTEEGPKNGTTYAVLAVQKSDRTPMPELTDTADDFLLSNTFAQPVLAIPELNPMAYTLHAETYSTTVDGVRYLLIACDNVEIFADRDVVLCVSTGGSNFSTFAFCYDESTGAITANPDYAGVNLVFDLPLDRLKADPEAAQAFIRQWQEAPSNGVAWEDRADTKVLHNLLEKYPQAVRDIGEKIGEKTVPFLTQAPEGCQNAGAGWYFGKQDDTEFTNFALAGYDTDRPIDELRKEWDSAYPVGKTQMVSMMSDSNTQKRWVHLTVRGEDDSMTAECWQLPYDSGELYDQLNAWAADNAGASQ